jgi:hypothetical protein
MISDKNVWTEFISEARARKVARALRQAGYATATIGKCRGYVVNVANYFEPGDTEARQKLLEIITTAAGIRPRQGN